MRNCKEENIVVGIDEVGRGPVAGPVAVCAVFASRKKLREIKKQVDYKDSKKMTSIGREKVFEYVKKQKKTKDFSYKISFVSSRIIDLKGISFALASALDRTLLRLSIKEGTRILLDGGLKAPAKFINQKTLIRGDQIEDSIALASVLAKVMRDRRMKNYDHKFPGYDFSSHKGYGTKRHMESIKKKNLSPIHRKSFLKNIV